MRELVAIDEHRARKQDARRAAAPGRVIKENKFAARRVSGETKTEVSGLYMMVNETHPSIGNIMALRHVASPSSAAATAVPSSLPVASFNDAYPLGAVVTSSTWQDDFRQAIARSHTVLDIPESKRDWQELAFESFGALLLGKAEMVQPLSMHFLYDPVSLQPFLRVCFRSRLRSRHRLRGPFGLAARRIHDCLRRRPQEPPVEMVERGFHQHSPRHPAHQGEQNGSTL